MTGRGQRLGPITAVALLLLATLTPAAAQSGPGAGPMAGMPHMTSSTAARDWWRPLVVGAGVVLLGAGIVAYRRRRARPAEPVRMESAAVLVVDLVESTHLATHWGDRVAMRARNALKDRAMAAARPHGLLFAESTGDGWFMTFPTPGAAVAAAVGLMDGLRADPVAIPPAPPLAARAAVTYGEILLDERGNRHGATINKAFRLIEVSPDSFARVTGATAPEGEVSDRNRVLLDEEVDHELAAAAPPRRFVGFVGLKGFPGLHRVWEVGER